jgi:hypothetical protein
LNKDALDEAVQHGPDRGGGQERDQHADDEAARGGIAREAQPDPQ